MHKQQTEGKENSSILGLLGLAIRARRVKGGAVAVEATIRAGQAQLVLLAQDSAENTRRQFRRLTKLFGIPLLEQHTREEYGECLQGAPRAVIVILDRHFAAGMLKKAGVDALRIGKPTIGR